MFIKSPVLCCGENITFHQVAKFSVPLQDEFMERFSWHVADKGFRMVRYYGFLSPVKRRLLEEVVYVITETVRKMAMQITRRGMYQRLLKVDPLKCILC
ncbi:IS91 family transposase (plasmid) [Escherichia coli]|nr:IS91 family transposase [Escherichia coli]